jgi:sugar phosphate isomerase/epimerase
LLITQRVWGTEPWGKLMTAKATAEEVAAPVVVVHPPFRWQREYARSFVSGVEAMRNETDVTFAVENMFPWRARRRQAQAYLPGWNPVGEDYSHLTLDLSHTAVSQSDAVEMATEMGDRLAHVHLADGSGSGRDEHLIPGRGTQPCGEVLEGLARGGFTGSVIVEVNTRKAANRSAREQDLTEALAFARLNLATAIEPS